MANHGHDEAIKAKALTIAAAAGIGEASAATGVPTGTIKRWRSEDRANRAPRTEPNEPNGYSKSMKALAQQATADAIAEAGDYIANRLKGLADNLYSLAENAVVKVEVAIRDKDEEAAAADRKEGEAHDRDGAAWLRSLVGVLSQAIDKAQLLSGKPTVRPEVIDRREIHITEEIIATQPQLLDTIFAANQRPGVASGSSPGARPGMELIR